MVLEDDVVGVYIQHIVVLEILDRKRNENHERDVQLLLEIKSIFLFTNYFMCFDSVFTFDK